MDPEARPGHLRAERQRHHNSISVVIIYMDLSLRNILIQCYYGKKNMKKNHKQNPLLQCTQDG